MDRLSDLLVAAAHGRRSHLCLGDGPRGGTDGTVNPQANGLVHLPFGELAAHERVRALIAGCLQDTNSRLPRWETIKRFAVLTRELTVAGGDLTPSLKLKRRAVTAKHHDLLESLYDGTSAATSTADRSATA